MKRPTVAFVTLLPLLATAQIPEPVLPQGVGVNIHFVTGGERDLDLIAAAGFKFIRMDFGWEATEKARGEYDWAGYDELTANLAKRGLRQIYIFDYSHKLYEDEVEAVDPPSGQVHKTIASRRACWSFWMASACIPTGITRSRRKVARRIMTSCGR
jgi:hypothetical protein